MLSISDLESRPDGIAALAFARSKTSPRSRGAYAIQMRRWITWCDKLGLDALEVNEYHFDLFLAEVNEAGISSGGLKLLQSVIINFYKYLVERHAIPASPVPSDWRVPFKPAIRVDQFLAGGELAQLVAAGDADRDPEAGCVLRLITRAYMRLNEICDLQVEQVEFVDGGGARIQGLTQPGSIAEEREVDEETAQRLRDSIGARGSGPAVLNRYGNPQNQKSVQRIIDRCSHRAGFERHLSPNLLRNSAVALLLGSGVAPLRFGLAGEQHKLRPALMREYFDGITTGRPGAREVEPVAFVTELLALASVLSSESGTQPVAPVVLTGTALEFFLKRFALAAGSTKSGRGIEVWATSLRTLGAITKEEKKLIDVWAEWRNMAVHDDAKRLTPTTALHMHQQVTEFVTRHADRLRSSSKTQGALFEN